MNRLLCRSTIYYDLYSQVVDEELPIVEVEGSLMRKVGQVRLTRYDGRNGLFISHLLIHPNHRRNGFGNIMMQEIHRVAISKKVNRLQLYVEPHNIPAINLYLKHGYYCVETLYSGEYIYEKAVRHAAV
jgi:ribosomal protein S18 acetylase RimI-like enzyme